jgi:hypothetical protein
MRVSVSAVSFVPHIDALFFNPKRVLIFQKLSLPYWKMQAFVCRIEISRDFTLFSVGLKRHNSPSVRSASVACDIGRDSSMRHGRFIGIINLIMLSIGTNPFCVRIIIFNYMLLSCVLMRSALFWVITQDIQVIPYRRFGITYRLNFQGSRNSRFLLLHVFSLIFFCSPFIWSFYCCIKALLVKH